MIRREVRLALWQWREVLLAAAVAGAGLWIAAQGGLVLMPIGLLLAGLALAAALQGWRRMRFAQGAEAPGIVEVDEAQISYMGPQVGGFISVAELVEVRLVSLRGRRLWRLRQADGQALLVPVDAAGADALFDVFAALPGMDMAALLSALDPQGDGAGQMTGRGLVAGEQMQVIWRRVGRGVAAV